MGVPPRPPRTTRFGNDECEIPDFVRLGLLKQGYDVNSQDDMELYYAVGRWVRDRYKDEEKEEKERELDRRMRRNLVWSASGSVISGVLVAVMYYLLVTKYHLL